jgi:hypothetical protein
MSVYGHSDLYLTDNDYIIYLSTNTFFCSHWISPLGGRRASGDDNK